MKFAASLVLLIWLTVGPLDARELTSPDGQIVVALDVTHGGGLGYSVAYRGKPILGQSRLGLELEDMPALAEGFRVVNVTTDSHDEIWRPVYGERSRIRDHYNRMAVDLEDEQKPPRRLRLTFRAYDEGVAFCYTIPRQPALKRIHVTRENSEFVFLDDHKAWAVYSAQGEYHEVRLGELKPGCERPLTVECAEDTFVALAEARLVDYARMKFSPIPGRPHGLVSSLSSSVEAELPLTTPWRVIMLAKSAGQLLENNDILLNLNAPCAIEDTSWIRPGKVIREVTLTTVGGKTCVDFAAKHGLQYVEFDAGWYGHEYSADSDATTVNVDPRRSPGPLDLPEVIRYAEQRGIGILLYVNRRALEKQIDDVLPLLQAWGIKGVKYGFVNVGSQQWTSWLHEAVRKAAAHRLMVDVHDEYRPTGYSRTYPNLMTQEGIGGDETAPSNEQTLTILFTRMLAGAGDNTICYYDSRVTRNASHAYQLAKTVCVYSPWQFLYWYDRPAASPRKTGGAGGSSNTIGEEPELEFFDHVPTVWDETKVLHGQIGRYAVIARRSGERWFIGCMNSGEARTLEIPLTFLDPDKPYTAHVYSDDATVPTRTHVKIDRLPVNAKDVLKATMSAQGGQAIRIEP
ncbi:MAG: glycoside hydrolase family 97 N-terminal domain-containing protein, partial [Thermoguttaceae bacterium]